MMSNATEHEQQRGERVRRQGEADAAAEGQLVVNVGGVSGRQGDAFAKAASRDILKNMTGASLESRITSRAHYNSKGG